MAERPSFTSLDTSSREFAALKEAEKRGERVLIVPGMINVPRDDIRITVFSKCHAHEQVGILTAKGRISADEARVIRLQIDESSLPDRLADKIVAAMKTAIENHRREKIEKVVKFGSMPN